MFPIHTGLGVKKMKQNWFPTLSEALESEGLSEHWDMFFAPIHYGQNFRWTVEDNGRYRHISIYRDDEGRYERPVHYDAGKVR